MKFRLREDKNFKMYNANPRGELIGDCVIRALSLALDKPYDEVFKDFKKYNMLPDEDGESNYKMRYNIANLIKDYGYIDYQDVNTFPKDIDERVSDICKHYPEGTWIVGCTRHLTVVKDGILYDTYDCSKMKVEEIWRVA